MAPGLFGLVIRGLIPGGFRIAVALEARGVVVLAGGVGSIFFLGRLRISALGDLSIVFAAAGEAWRVQMKNLA